MLAGSGRQVQDDYLRAQRSELEWIRGTLRAWNLVARRLDASSGAVPQQRIDIVVDRWIRAQDAYGARVAGGRQHGRTALSSAKARRLRRLGSLIYAAGLTLAVVLLVTPWSQYAPLMLLLSMGPALYGLFSLYADKRGYDQEARQYEQSGLLFATARQRVMALQAVPSATSDADRRALIEELGCVALAESGDWLILHRERFADVVAV